MSPELLAGDPTTWEVLSTALGDRAGPFIAASNQRAEVQIRANIARIDRQALATLLAEDGILTKPCRLAPHGLTVQGRANLRGHRAFSRGLFEVQDEGSQLLAELVPSVGSVLDLCAGAGGKSLALAASGARVHALDVRARPLLELQKRARRAGLTILTDTLSSDGALPSHIPADYDADAVLVDAPCSGSGTWRRHPELRWRLTELAQTATLQASILARAASLVRPGGVLVYGTCSVLPAENEAQVDRFLGRHPDFRLEPLGRPDLGGDVLRLAPDTHGTDGFFGAKLRRA